jgi:hypothetical protein
MQSALDSAALMVSKDLSSGAITTSQIGAKAQAYFSALYTNTDQHRRPGGIGIGDLHRQLRMRVAMALDNTGSMAQDDKIGALRTAATAPADRRISSWSPRPTRRFRSSTRSERRCRNCAWRGNPSPVPNGKSPANDGRAF